MIFIIVQYKVKKEKHHAAHIKRLFTKVGPAACCMLVHVKLKQLFYIRDI